ncbi:MAG TPA: hypothetical protein VMU19_11495 [Bryobacteraceae bacterium]|nr:hypothetical protein [Bryobacteraceae bacterium]
MLAAIVRYYSYAFHALLALFLIGVSAVALGSSPTSLRLDMLPWSGATLTYVVFFGGLFGLLTVALAFLHKLPVLFFVWALAVLVLLVKGYVFSGYGFEPGGFATAVELTIGALLTLPGSWLQMRPARN